MTSDSAIKFLLITLGVGMIAYALASRIRTYCLSQPSKNNTGKTRWDDITDDFILFSIIDDMFSTDDIGDSSDWHD